MANNTSSTLNATNASPGLPCFHVQRRPDGIIVMHFDDFSRSVVEQWVAHVRSKDGKLRSPLRVLYDFRDAGPPSPYALQIVGPLMQELTIPEDTRSAYLFKSRLDTHFARSIIRRMPAKVGKVRAFTDLEDAVAWLLEGIR
jgi:hypothetical protein